MDVAPRELNRASESLAALLEGSAEGFCALDADWRITYVNPAAARLLARPREALVGDDATSALGDHDACNELRQAVHDRGAGEVRVASRAGAGGSGGGAIVIRAARSDAGVTLSLRESVPAVATAVESGVDLAHPRPQESAELLAVIGEVAPNFLWVTDDRGHVQYVNRRWVEYTGLSVEQVQGGGFANAIHPDDRASFDAEVARARRDGNALEGEWRYRRRDGVYRWFWVRSTTLRDGSGNVLRRVGMAADVDDRRRAEQAVRDSEQRYRGIFDQAAMGIVEADGRGVITAVNQRFCDMLGYAREELVERCTPLDLTHPNDAHESRQRIAALLAGEVESCTLEKRYLRKDGSEVWSRTAVSAVRDPAHPAGGVRVVAVVQDVTAQRRLAEARRQSEELTRHIVEHAPVGILVADTRGRFLHVNDTWLDMLGYSREEVVLGKVNWKELTVPEHRHLDQQAIEQVRAGGAHPPFEKTLVRKDGSRVPCLAATAYLGGPREVGVGFLVDLTEVKRAQEQVQASEARLQAIIDSVAAVVYVKDMHGRYRLINRHFEQVLGVDAATMIGKTDHDFFDRDVADALCANDRKVLEAGQPMQFEESAAHPDGLHTYLSVKFPLRDERGAVYAICGVSTDIHERKKAEEALRESEGKYRTLTDAVGSLMWMSDARGEVSFYNRRWDEFLAGNGACMLGSGWKDLVHPEDIPAVIRERNVSLAQGSEYSVELRLRRHDGQYRWHLARIVPHKDAVGQVLNWFGTATDIHDLKSAESAVRQAKAEAEQASAAKDQFLAVLSHELRTPLTPVVMTVAAMEMDRTVSPQMREDLAMIRRNIELETRLIDDLLDVTRISNGKLRLNPRPTDVHALMRHVLDMLKSDVADKKLKLTADLAAADAEVSADPARLQQVFWNLVKNAIKFTPAGGNVRVATASLGEKAIRIEVSDDGAGIDPAVLPRIFNAFDQGEQSVTRQFGGLGLGLAISKALTDLHGGTILAESEGKGRGARFVVELPTMGAIQRLVEQIQPLPGACDEERKIRVLLVEDHPDTQRMLRRLLEDRGYRVTVAGSVGSALSWLERHQADVLVSDIGLPDATGHDLMRRVKQLYAIPGIAVSGFGMDADIRQSTDAGFSAHLTKPVDLGQLDTLLRSLAGEGRPTEPASRT